MKDKKVAVLLAVGLVGLNFMQPHSEDKSLAQKEQGMRKQTTLIIPQDNALTAVSENDLKAPFAYQWWHIQQWRKQTWLFAGVATAILIIAPAMLYNKVQKMRLQKALGLAEEQKRAYEGFIQQHKQQQEAYKQNLSELKTCLSVQKDVLATETIAKEAYTKHLHVDRYGYIGKHHDTTDAKIDQIVKEKGSRQPLIKESENWEQAQKQWRVNKAQWIKEQQQWMQNAGTETPYPAWRKKHESLKEQYVAFIASQETNNKPKTDHLRDLLAQEKALLTDKTNFVEKQQLADKKKWITEYIASLEAQIHAINTAVEQLAHTKKASHNNQARHLKSESMKQISKKFTLMRENRAKNKALQEKEWATKCRDAIQNLQDLLEASINVHKQSIAYLA